MLESLSPDLVLVLPPAQRAAAIRALPAFEPWRPRAIAPPTPLAPPRPGLGRVLGASLLYFAARFALVVSTAVVLILGVIAIAVGIALLF